jgi:hypothetical protein
MVNYHVLVVLIAIKVFYRFGCNPSNPALSPSGSAVERSIDHSTDTSVILAR